jgi:predicted oxidoreductase (fatty acid repression mutant protein)
MSSNFNQAYEKRRSYYMIGKESPISTEEIQNIVNHAVTFVPSAFHSQSARVVILFNEQHDKLWEITRETLRNLVPAESFSSTNEKIDSFQNGFGTILYFEDQAVVENLQEMFGLYKDSFPVWSLQSSGMLQFTIWTALEDAGLGASLQHYNPLIDDQVKSLWKLPDKWKLLAQMPFGKPLAAPSEKEFLPLEGRVKVFA